LRAADDLGVLQRALRRLRLERPDLRVEIEAETLDQVRDFLSLTGIDVILLDNMSLATMRQAVRLGAGRVKFEASGRMTLKRVRAVAATGVDFISVGTLTHSAPAIDFSLEIVG
jgi:nicotinate-nucleotide pyrophosphorylase (carboxylating)